MPPKSPILGDFETEDLDLKSPRMGDLGGEDLSYNESKGYRLFNPRSLTDSISIPIHLIQKAAMVSSFGQTGTTKTSKTFCRIVGIVCLIGFAIDLLVLALPPNPLVLEWRVGFLQQVSDRSLILPIGAALTLYGYVESRRQLQQISLLSLLVGVLLTLSCLLAVRDVSSLQQQSVLTINDQAAKIQTQIQQAKDNPTNLPKNITIDQLTQASQQISGQAETLRQSAKLGGVRTGVASVGNLLIAGLGLVAIGRYGVRLRRS